MTITRVAYMPLITYPDCVTDEAVAAAAAVAAALGVDLHATAFAAEIPAPSSPLGGFLLNASEMIRAAEETSRARARHLHGLLQAQAGGPRVHCADRAADPGATATVAAGEARYFDLALVPWLPDMLALQDLAQAILFGAGRPVILVPPSAGAAPIRHLAVAWDSSRVAARALADAMPLVSGETRISVLTVEDEKPLGQQDIAGALAAALSRRGLQAAATRVPLGPRSIAAALQDAAVEAGAGMLVMGGYGHSRLREFVLGGATRGILADLRLPVLMSH